MSKGIAPFSPFIIILVFIPLAWSLKFLCYIPNVGRSHVNFQGKISDVLIENGHEVVILNPIIEKSLPVYKPKAGGRVITVDPCLEAQEFSENLQRQDHVGKNMWNAGNPAEEFKNFEEFYRMFGHQCNATLRTPGLLEQLKAENFDAAYAEPLDPCGVVIFHLLGIKKHAATHSFSTYEGYFRFTGAPEAPSYVPGLVSNAGEAMTFMERVWNTLGTLFLRKWYRDSYQPFQEMMRNNFPDIPDFHGLYNEVSLTFVNSEPLIDFPRPTTHNIVDIGGIVTGAHKPVEKKYSDILSLRNKTILLSFGTITSSSSMPDSFKNSIRQVFESFPDVTFIWKYEKPEDDIAQGVPNIIPLEWLPQNDLLNDPRLSGFITHGGIGSMMETTAAGIPLICIPIFGDQARNCQASSEFLRTFIKDVLTTAIQKILNDPIYAENAKRTARMIAKRPFTMRERLVRNMEFVAEFGPLDNLRHYGNKLNYIQYYLIDVLAFLATIALTAVTVTMVVAWHMLKWVGRVILVKPKSE